MSLFLFATVIPVLLALLNHENISDKIHKIKKKKTPKILKNKTAIKNRHRIRKNTSISKLLHFSILKEKKY